MTMTLEPGFIRCHDCAELVPARTIALTSPEVVCDPCRQAAYVRCSVCSTWALTGDTVTTGDHAICERCWEGS